jgi:thiaminase
LLYHTQRTIKTNNQADYTDLIGKLTRNANYCLTFLKNCIDNLGLTGDTVISTPVDQATKEYIAFAVDIAEKYGWAVSLVALIPCIQVSTPTRTPIDYSEDGN